MNISGSSPQNWFKQLESNLGSTIGAVANIAVTAEGTAALGPAFGVAQ